MSQEYDILQAELESEAGGKILNNAMVRIQAGTATPEVQAGMHGLLVLTQKRLLFKHYPQDNWFSGMFSARGRRGTDRSILIDYSNSISFKRQVETSLFQRIFFRLEPFYRIEYSDSNNSTQTIQLTIVFCKSGEESFFSQLSALLETATE